MAAIKNILKDLDVSKDHDPESIKAFFMEEIWKDIPGYEGHYQVSNQGRVKSLDRINYFGKYSRLLKGKVLKNRKDSKGYHYVTLPPYKNFRVHQLVAMAFLKHTPKNYNAVVDHIDSNRLNNNIKNLQVISQRENTSKRENTSSKYTGVSWNKRAKKWKAEIRINGPKKYLGYFKCEFAAHLAYQKELNKIK